ncbi:MAG: leucine--tRNA ligase [Candidatus Bathyarchaeota archaeon]|nr:leucine--tRNA ligase [Candidatus Bathyarchaeum tardum]
MTENTFNFLGTPNGLMTSLSQMEKKWQKKWQGAKIFEADPDSNKEKYFITFPFSYMNGPLHVGHGFTATRVDAIARYKRMKGFNVLFPWAWHWTGETIAGASERVKNGDETLIRAFREMDGVSEENLKKFVDPVFMAKYYTDDSRESVKRIGYSVDWRREFHTTSLYPTFSKFVEWQCERLRDKGYIIKGTYPVVWCPHDQSPTGDHDRQTGEGVVAEEYTLIKYKMEDGTILPSATFRPETIYGITNIWINPDADYVKAQVNGETWIISQVAANKLTQQLKKVTIIETFKGKQIIGKLFTSPLSSRKMLILPGWFVSPDNATGVVYSVPAHAPFDYLALRDLQNKPELLKEFGIEPQTVKNIQPISLINVEGFGEYPAVELVEKMEIKDQHDPKAEEATKTLYKKEFHGGTLKPICEEYAGKPVNKIKDILIVDFKEKGIADSMYDLPDPVVCRCMTPCVVKLLEGQWFVKYSDPEWKQQTKDTLSQASIYPDSARQWFLNIIDWLKEWPCARKSGLGTALPWSPGWIVETLTDSTVYMAFYTINKHLKKYNIQGDQLTLEVFDYLFYGKGNPATISEQTKISTEILEEMRNEFLYWYPLDLRISAKELLPNHLTFFLFQHTALFPEHLPQAVGVNGMLSIESKKMSKSKGNFITLKDALNKFGADATRCALLLGGEGMNDPDWRADTVKDFKTKLRGFQTLAENIIENSKSSQTGHMEKWLLSVLQQKIKIITENMEALKTRTALEHALFEVWNDFRWYVRRTENLESLILKQGLETWTRLLAPFAPYLCEELYSQMGYEDFVSVTNWPEYDENKVDIQAEESENLVKNVLEDTANILKATKMVPKQIYFYCAASWKWKTYISAVKKSSSGNIVIGALMKELMADPELKPVAGKLAKFVQGISQEINRMPEDIKQKQLQADVLDETKLLKTAKTFFEKEFNVTLNVYTEDDSNIKDPQQKARFAKPYRPAIYIE